MHIVYSTENYSIVKKFTLTFITASELSQKDCKRACKLCKKLTIEDPVAGKLMLLSE
jgi:hypothetical protein